MVYDLPFFPGPYAGNLVFQVFSWLIQAMVRDSVFFTCMVVFAIFVYTVFYLVFFGVDEIKWMFINAALGLVRYLCPDRPDPVTFWQAG